MLLDGPHVKDREFDGRIGPAIPDIACSILAMRLFLLCLCGIALVSGSPASDERTVAALDVAFQAATKANDVAGIDSILAPDYVLVLGDGRTQTKADLLNEAREKTATYEHQEDTNRTVRVWGNTAVVTALLWGKGTTRSGKSFDKHLWFSDTYVRSASGWHYVFAQASLPLPVTPRGR